ncbi:unnamed protein product [Thlaspi arvense]|uniref:3-oxo-5-alpha-steroid 4-dehydrogenase C-terminal domain-containing protein n=1 Tax=Thlaspi arvense TaxID=13288 RepID=A0AAU9RV19_THLAR|nr:unnamed protein product [Thlaspi arvense]
MKDTRRLTVWNSVSEKDLSRHGRGVNASLNHLISEKSPFDEAWFVPVDWWSYISLGMVTTRRCHAILILRRYKICLILGSLRKGLSQVNEYIIPHGDWFEIVSSPHYLAEIVGNLTLAAGETHRISGSLRIIRPTGLIESYTIVAN